MTQSRRSLSEPLAQASTDSFVRAVPATAELFAAGYELWSDPLYAYVSKRVAGRQVRERIVREVLSQNLDLLVGRREEMSEASRLMTSADRLIADAVEEADLFLDRRRQERSSRQRRRERERILHTRRESAPGEVGMTTSGKTDQIKGRVKQATGVLTGDKQLEREGKLDRAAGNLKERGGRVVDKLRKAIKR